MRSLHVSINDRRVGTLSEGDDLWAFTYDAHWAAAADSFDLSPALRRSQAVHEDGGSNRPVQWYFDNLLPEEQLRDTLSKEAGIPGDDAFALLEDLGAESAGSLVLTVPGSPVPTERGLRPLSDEALAQRIKRLPTTSLSHEAPKRMSVAGAQHKLLVVYRDDRLYEPVGTEPSTHILKPNHPDDDYPASVINEFVTMRLAAELKLSVPPVYRRYTPEPIYLVARFDRHADANGHTQRRHIIDACQLLNKPRGFKYRAASLQTLRDVIAACRNRAATRLRLYRWLVLNVLIANNDNHLKNLSFLVDAEGVSLAPAYDLLSTATYNTRVFAHQRATWPGVEMAIALGDVVSFGQVTREALLQAGEVLGLTSAICERELGRFVKELPTALAALVATIEAENAVLGEAAKAYLAGEMRLLRAIRHLIVPEMIQQVA